MGLLIELIILDEFDPIDVAKRSLEQALDYQQDHQQDHPTRAHSCHIAVSQLTEWIDWQESP